MALSPSAIVVVLALLSAFAQEQPLVFKPQSNQAANDAAMPNTVLATCHVTIPASKPFATTFPVSRLEGSPLTVTPGMAPKSCGPRCRSAVPINGVWRRPVPASSSDFGYDNKMPWYSNHAKDSKAHGPMVITGRRLDGPAPVFTGTFADVGMVGIAIPEFGCWQITGHYRDAELTFTVWITQERQGESALQAPPNESSAPVPAPRRIDLDRDSQAKLLVYRSAPVIPEGVDTARVRVEVYCSTRSSLPMAGRKICNTSQGRRFSHRRRSMP